ncbi:MAG TPA: AAA family ATPase [Solirubrobacter sp.]|nr:AAA family ATPase [Solirubrobacter sp.]
MSTVDVHGLVLGAGGRYGGAAMKLPDALMDSAAFPDRPADIELHETHISWVFVAGGNAYKVKKPVAFPFLDYSTPERRRMFCHAELRLNRRFAPAIYRDVVGLVPRGPAGLAVAGEHDPRAVEYAVAMRRYDEASTLAARLPTLSEDDARAVGAAIARWHADAPRGTGQPLAEVVDETLTTLGEAAGAVPALARFFHAALTGFAADLAARPAVDGHGDLRAEHILLGDRIQAVDGLEFDPGLRIADPGYDLAFLLMDVSRADDALAQAILDGYRAAGGDPGSDALLACFCALRALVRAKVDLLRAAQLDGDAAAERAERGRGLLALAERYAWRARLPRVVAVTGLPASGKSTVAGALAAATGRPVLSSDVIRKQRAGLDPRDRAPADAYSDEESRAVYAELAREAHAHGAIVDATFRRPADAAAFLEHAPETAWLVCEAPPDVLLERARTRTGSASDAGEAFVARELAAHPGPFRAPGPELARLDTTPPVPEILAGLAAALDARLGTLDT